MVLVSVQKQHSNSSKYVGCYHYLRSDIIDNSMDSCYVNTKALLLLVSANHLIELVDESPSKDQCPSSELNAKAVLNEVVSCAKNVSTTIVTNTKS